MDSGGVLAPNPNSVLTVPLALYLGYSATMPARPPSHPLQPGPPERCSRAGHKNCSAHPEIKSPEASRVIPLGTLKQVLRDKMRGIMSEDRDQLLKVWREFEPRRLGYMTRGEFISMLKVFGVEIDTPGALHFMSRLIHKKGQKILPFEDFFASILGSDRGVLLGTGKPELREKAREARACPHAAPVGTSIAKMRDRLVLKLRETLFNVNRAVRLVMKVSKGSQLLGEDELWFLFRDNGIVIHPRRRVIEIVKHYDKNQDGKATAPIHQLLPYMDSVPKIEPGRQGNSSYSSIITIYGQCS